MMMNKIPICLQFHFWIYIKILNHKLRTNVNFENNISFHINQFIAKKKILSKIIFCLVIVITKLLFIINKLQKLIQRIVLKKLK
jgi:hypothetical protein